MPEWAISRPVTVWMLTLSMLGLGLIAWRSMPLTFLPRVDDPFVGVSIPYPGAAPEQVEQEISIPVEGEFRTIPGLERIRTISDTNGCFALCYFGLETDMNVATAEIRDRVERLRLILPDEVDQMLIQRFNSQSIPIMATGLFRDGDADELDAFIQQLRTILEPRLRRLDGIADVQIHSPVQEKEVLIEFDQSRLHALNLGLWEVIGALRQSSISVSVGELKGGERKFLVRAIGEYRRLDDIAELIVNPNGLRLKEIAEVNYKSREQEAHVSLDRQSGALILLVKESEANTVSTCQAAAAELDEVMKLDEFQGVNKLVFFNQAELITNALNNLRQSGIYGCVMAIIILFVFLHRIRPTIIVALAIPASTVVALVFMFFYGMELNLITMVSLIIAVGMLVDNAIVVVENIIRYQGLGYSPKESAKKGAREVSMAILASTATTWVVFVPMYFLDAGRMSVFMEQLGLPLIVALFGSLIIALTVVPLAMSRIRPRRAWDAVRPVSRPVAALARMLPRWAPRHPVERIVLAYSIFVRFSQRWRLAGVMLLAAVLALTWYWPYQSLGVRDLPELDTREVQITVELDQNFDMAMADDVFARLQEVIEKRREELGVKNIMTFYTAAGGDFDVYLYTDSDGEKGLNPPYGTEEVMRILSELLPGVVPGAELHFAMTGVGSSGTRGQVSIGMMGDDAEKLEDYAGQFLALLENLPSVRDAEIEIEQKKREIQLQIDEPLAERYGIPAISIAQTADAAMRGARLPYMKQGIREIPVWAQFREEDRKSRANLDNVTVQSVLGTLIPLNQLVHFGKAQSPDTILRVDGKNVLTINATADAQDLLGIRQSMEKIMSQFQMPTGYKFYFGDELEELGENFANFFTTMLMAIVLIYIVMASLFESYLYPLSILSSVPLALGGGVWLLYFTGSELDTVTFIGCILMAGLIVNNGIVIVDHINTLRKEGLARTDAIAQAGRDRFRPVMMTALTTILGLLPLAMATTGGAATFAGLGRALIGGMTAGTLLTLFVVPMFYSLIDDFQHWALQYIGALRPNTRKRPAAE
ncbi:MAG: efflux RND transporter permease subunit [Candidatus Hydrogenedentes bacterium]|nr:efflux RND transporter permease subunit [Candidatus Hydrogenedentota bacterium]